MPRLRSSASFALLGLMASAGVMAADAHHGHHQSQQTAATAAADVTVLDRPLLDPSGKSLVLGDALGRRPSAVIGFFYSSCDVACPITTTLLQGTMARLSEHQRSRTQVVLITLDPATDTPEVLVEYRKRMRVPDDWILLTGRPADVNQVLVGLGAYASDLEEHPPQLLVRADPDSELVRLFGLPSAVSVAQVLRQH